MSVQRYRLLQCYKCDPQNRVIQHTTTASWNSEKTDKDSLSLTRFCCAVHSNTGSLLCQDNVKQDPLNNNPENPAVKVEDIMADVSKEFEERFEETWQEVSMFQLVQTCPNMSSDLFQIDANGNGFLSANELKDALDHAGFKLANHKVRDLLNDLKTKGKYQDSAEGISKALFKEVRTSLLVYIFCLHFFRCPRYALPKE